MDILERMDHGGPEVVLTTHGLGHLFTRRERGFLIKAESIIQPTCMCDPTYLTQTHNFREAGVHRDGGRERSGGTIVVPRSGIDERGGIVDGGVRHGVRRGVAKRKGKADEGSSGMGSHYNSSQQDPNP